MENLPKGLPGIYYSTLVEDLQAEARDLVVKLQYFSLKFRLADVI